MSAYLDQFSEERDCDSFTPIRQCVVIASTQRSGSTLLGHYLEATGAFGVPLEYFNEKNLAHWRKRFDFETTEQFLDQIERVRTSANGVFAIKSHYFQLRSVGSLAHLKARYGDCRFVRILRRDLLKQAISRTVAQQTGVWISGQSRQRDPWYDRDRIAANLREILRQQNQWPLAFGITGTRYLDIYYEDLIADPENAIHTVADFCEISRKSLILPQTAPIEGQKRTQSGEWAERFRSEQSESDEALLAGRVSIRTALRDLAKGVLKARREGVPKLWRTSPNLASATARIS